MYFEINKKIKIRTLNGVQHPDLYDNDGRSVNKLRPYNANLYDMPLMITTNTPDLAKGISSRDDFVVDVAIVRPWRSMILYLVSGAEAIKMVWFDDQTFTLGVSEIEETGVEGFSGSDLESGLGAGLGSVLDFGVMVTL